MKLIVITIKTAVCGVQTLYRSSRPKVFRKSGVLRKFAKLTGKHFCQSLYSNKVAGLRPVTFLKKDCGARVFL